MKLKRKYSNLKLIFTLVIVFASFSGFSQLDSIHWIPPMTSTDFASSAGAYEHTVYLSTEESTAFDVTVTTGTGTAIGTYSISNTSPKKVVLANGSNYLCLEADSVGSVQKDDGMILTASKNFYANYRIRSNAQGGSLTAKGQIAKGQDFYWGGVPIIGNSNKMNGVMGIMATEDNTTVTIADYNTSCEFRLGSNSGGITSNSVVVNLDEGETFVLECVNLVNAANADGWLGAHVTSNKDIVMNNGNLMGGVVTSSANRDICMDQTLPTSRLGTEHITLEGNGLTDTELVIVVGVEDDTDISVNGAAPVTTIHEGDYYVLDGSNYSAQGNMYIETTRNVYLYQVLAGSSNKRTIGLNFIPPLSCLLPVAVDNISDIDKINTTSYTGAVSILTRSGATVQINGSPPVSSPNSVTGTTDWVTYLESGLTGDVSIASDEPMAAGMFGANSDAGFAGYFSGFSERTTPVIEAADSCVSTQLTLLNTGVTKQWHFEGAPMGGETFQTHLATVEGSYFTVIGAGTCTDTSNIITLTCNSLPIELGYFVFECENNMPKVEWKTLSEYNNDYFEIWKSDDGEYYEFLSEIDGQGTTLEPHVYEYPLGSGFRGNYLKLSQTDFDGSRKFFDEVSYKECSESTFSFNIQNNVLTIETEGVSEINIYSQIGSLMRSPKIGANKVNIESLDRGVYLVQIICANDKVYFERIYFSGE